MRRWLADRRLVLATGVAAGLPVIVATIDVATSGWIPLADDALIAISAYDVPTADSPLLGPWSSGFSDVIELPTFHPGPLLFWLLALPARLPWPPALEVTMGLVNLACVVGSVGLANRRGGRPLMFATAIGIPIMLASLPAETYSDIWNPSAPLMPFQLLLFLAWSLALGEHRLLPLTLLTASFAIQCHLSFLVPALGVTAIGVGGLALSRRRELLAPPARAWLIGGLAVAAVCWSAPLIDQITNQPGNMRQIWWAVKADQSVLGVETGWRALVHTVGVVPWWLEDPRFSIDRIVDLSQSPGAIAVGSTALVLAGLIALALLGRRRGRPDVSVAALLALVVCASAVVVTASTPKDSFDTLGYSMRWVSPAGLWVWLVVGWSAASLWLAGRVSAARLAFLRPAPIALAAIVVVGALVAAAGGLIADPYDETRELADGIDAAVPHDRPIGLGVSPAPDAVFAGLGIQSGILWSLRTEGRDVNAQAVADYLGPEYVSTDGEQMVRIDVGTQPPADGRQGARAPGRAPTEPQGSGASAEHSWTAVVTLMPTPPESTTAP